jgi:hypothetical protein
MKINVLKLILELLREFTELLILFISDHSTVKSVCTFNTKFNRNLILSEIGLGVWFGFYWLRIGAGSGLLCVR